MTQHPKNVAGPFYVEYGCCTACDVPMQEAPNHFAYDSENHCYVCRQPQTAAELTDMIGTARMAEFKCIRYRGNDPDVLRRFAELDLRRICDIQPPHHISPVIRNHVEFNVIGNADLATPQQLAAHFVAHLISQNAALRQYETKPIQTSAHSAALEFSWFEDVFHTIRFTAVPNFVAKWHVEHDPNGAGAHGVGNAILRWLSCSAGTFANICWYTDSDWHGSKIGHLTRF